MPSTPTRPRPRPARKTTSTVDVQAYGPVTINALSGIVDVTLPHLIRSPGTTPDQPWKLKLWGREAVALGVALIQAAQHTDGGAVELALASPEPTAEAEAHQ